MVQKRITFILSNKKIKLSAKILKEKIASIKMINVIILKNKKKLIKRKVKILIRKIHN